jgi:hypothetical protein
VPTTEKNPILKQLRYQSSIFKQLLHRNSVSFFLFFLETHLTKQISKENPEQNSKLCVAFPHFLCSQMFKKKRERKKKITSWA